MGREGNAGEVDLIVLKETQNYIIAKIILSVGAILSVTRISNVELKGATQFKLPF